MTELQGFAQDSYIVLDVPAPIAEQVKAIRQRHFYQLSVPVEITLAGSSGVGVLDPEQEPEQVFARLDQIAATVGPIRAKYGQVIRFPGTEIFVLSLQDQTPFQQLHEQVRGSGIRFGPNQFPYFPHTTLRHGNLPGGRSVTEDESRELLGFSITGEFVLDTFSIYSFYSTPDGQIQCPLLHRVKLGG